MNPDQLVIAACDRIWSDDSSLLTVKSFQEPSGYICQSGVDLPRVKFTSHHVWWAASYMPGLHKGPGLWPTSATLTHRGTEWGATRPGPPGAGTAGLRAGTRQSSAARRLGSITPVSDMRPNTQMFLHYTQSSSEVRKSGALWEEYSAFSLLWNLIKSVSILNPDD